MTDPQRIHLKSTIVGELDFSDIEARLAAIEHRLEIQDQHLNIFNDNLGVLMASFDAFNAELSTLANTVADAVRVLNDLKSAGSDQPTVDAATAAVESARTTLADAVTAAQG